MKRFNYPTRDQWNSLIQRPTMDQRDLKGQVETIIETVRKNGDKALVDYTRDFDAVNITQLRVDEEEIKAAKSELDSRLIEAIQLAKENIEKFHSLQLDNESRVEIIKGVECWRKSTPIEKVGLYIPGGSAPLFSSVLMLGIPARIAGCQEIVLCSPPDPNGQLNPAILFAASLIGINQIYKIGGAQAIAAMAFGTESVPSVYKIFGPGNQYVTEAKRLVQQAGVAIDMPAGPSEVLVLADNSANPSFVAADLLSQAEHGSDSQVILVSDNSNLIEKSLKAMGQQIEVLPRKTLAKKSIENSKAILVKDLDEGMEFSNLYCPEHLIIASEKATDYTDQVNNAGSVFLGNMSCESAGDYASGTNHTLPTNAFAKSYSGVSVDSFVKKITFQQISGQGLQNIGWAIESMAEAEGLMAHKNAVSIRLKSLSNV